MAEHLATGSGILEACQSSILERAKQITPRRTPTEVRLDWDMLFYSYSYLRGLHVMYI
jgi:hypothetical protein